MSSVRIFYIQYVSDSMNTLYELKRVPVFPSFHLNFTVLFDPLCIDVISDVTDISSLGQAVVKVATLNALEIISRHLEVKLSFNK